MGILLSAHDLGHTFGVRPLFSELGFTVSDGDRIGLIGPNGAGKSTLLKILAGALEPDRGHVARRGNLQVAYLAQVPTFVDGATVRDAVADGLPASMRGHGEGEARVDELLARLELSGSAAGADTVVDRLSGGWRKRVALGRALVADPELLLLDEPTNHLDVEAILWLEDLLATRRFGTITVTHDRAFLQSTSRRILELDARNAGGLLDVPGDYATYLDRKAHAMAAQEQREDVLRNTLRRETEWLRRGPAARTTKQSARIQRAEALANEVSELGARNRIRAVEVAFDARAKGPRRLIEGRELGKRYGERLVFGGVDVFVGPGSRIGLLGPNGCGKSTLLRVLLGTEPPTTGTVQRADDLQVVFFEQGRESLDPDLSPADTVCPDGDFVQYRGARVHRHGYLERFLFRSEQMSLPVGRLSGGEQSRLLIARLMLRPANILVLDEPTNDLDLPTLSVLEQALVAFDGAVLLVTHDRYFLDQVATQILAFHIAPGQEGQVTPVVGLNQWMAFHAAQTAVADAMRVAARGARGLPDAAAPPARRKKLSFKDQRDWDTLEERILEAEGRLSGLHASCSQPDIATDGVRLLALQTEMDVARGEIDALYARWAQLEGLVSG